MHKVDVKRKAKKKKKKSLQEPRRLYTLRNGLNARHQGRVGPEAVWKVHVQPEVGICYSALPLFKKE